MKDADVRTGEGQPGSSRPAGKARSVLQSLVEEIWCKTIAFEEVIERPHLTGIDEFSHQNMEKQLDPDTAKAIWLQASKSVQTM